MTREQFIYGLLDQNLSFEDEALFNVVFNDCSLTEIELAILNEGLKVYRCPAPKLSSSSLNEITGLLSKLESVDKRLALVVATGLSVSKAMNFEYEFARTILKRMELKEYEGFLGALRTIAVCLEDFLDLKVTWDLPRHKALRCLEQFEVASNTLRDRGQLRGSVYIGLVGLKMGERILPSLKLDWLLGQLKGECVYYGWTDLEDFIEAKMGFERMGVDLDKLRTQGAIEEWLYALEKSAMEAYGSGDTLVAAAYYKTVADYLLHGL